MARNHEVFHVIAIDTNILVRYVVRDDEAQYRAAAAFFSSRSSSDTAYVSFVVLAETVWVLRRHYGYSRAQIDALVMALLQASEMSFESEEYLSMLFASESDLKGDIADHLIAHSATRAGCATTITFDKRAAKAVPGMELLQ